MRNLSLNQINTDVLRTVGNFLRFLRITSYNVCYTKLLRCSSRNSKVEFGNPPVPRWLQNSNRLLTSCKGVIGVKTGFTDKAKRCLVSACQRDGVTLICVTLNDPNDWSDHANLYDYGFSQIRKVELPVDNQNMLLNVVGGKSEIAYLKQKEPANLMLYYDDVSKVEKKVLLPRFEYAPLKKGDIVGRADYIVNGVVINVITSYSIHYTKLYDLIVGFVLIFFSSTASSTSIGIDFITTPLTM